MHEESRKVSVALDELEWNGIQKRLGKPCTNTKQSKHLKLGEQTFHHMTQSSGAFIRVTSEMSCGMSARLPSQLYHFHKKKKEKGFHQNYIRMLL